MKIACVILHYRRLDDTLDCLASLKAADPAGWKIFLVNNHSIDGSGAVLEHWIENSGLDCDYIDPGFNTGFAGGCNLGLSAAIAGHFSHVLLLNNDTLVAQDFVQQVERMIAAHPAKILAGRVTDASGNPTHNIGRLSPLSGRVSHFLSDDSPGVIDFVSGCLMILPCSALQRTGLFDERLFMYCEDTDLCMRFKRQGIGIRYCPSIRIRHKFSATVSRLGIPKEYYLQRNQTYVILRRGTLLQKACYSLLLVAVPFYKALRRPRLFPQAIRGILDGLTGRMGKRHQEPGSTSGVPVSVCLNALFLQNHLGGIGNYAYQLASHLVKNHPGLKIDLMVHKGVAPNFRDIPGLGIVEIPLRSLWARLGFFHLVFPFMARRYSLLHSVGNMGLTICPIPQIITICDCYERVSPERFGLFKRIFMRIIISRSGARASRILTISESTQRDVSRFYPHLAAKCVTIYLGNKFAAVPMTTAVEKETFLFVGTLEPGKNLALALTAFARYHREFGGQFKVVGAMGWKQSHIRGLIESLGVGESVDFLGYIPDEELKKLYAGALALIQPSNYEGFGLSVVEAMACGCPAIAARNSGMIEAGGDAALFFTTKDEDDLLSKMRIIREHRDVREECIKKGFAHAARFTWEKTAEETAEVYLKVLRVAN